MSRDIFMLVRSLKIFIVRCLLPLQNPFMGLAKRCAVREYCATYNNDIIKTSRDYRLAKYRWTKKPLMAKYPTFMVSDISQYRFHLAGALW